uniref:Macrophage-expressed gene 1 protein n=1 Tax=Denticeps clupeoides TaxID=299321 RepID=A0AAY4DNZ4_9TELE
MDQNEFTMLALCLLTFGSVRPLPHSDNGLRNCRINSSSLALEVLPGGGWDNLRNLDMGRVMNFSYSQCQSTEDGVYLIPDEVFRMSEVISTWLDHRSSTSQTISVDASYLNVLNGKFSKENQQMKTYQVKDNSVTSRVQVRNHLYTVKVYPYFTLDSRFAQQVKEIANSLDNNQTRHADYLSEMLVVDYGTHVITAVDAGAILEQEDYLKSSYYESTEQYEFTSSAGLNFFETITFGFHGKGKENSSLSRSYLGNITHSRTQSHGGALFYPGITLQKWQESTLNNLVAIDRAGLPLHYVLNEATLPDLPRVAVRKLALSVREAAARYYNVNARPGCVRPDAEHFNFQANVDDGSCQGPAANLTFGGVFQNCTKVTGDADPLCLKFQQKNPDTGGYSCRGPYTAALLQSEAAEEVYGQVACYEECSGFFFWESCDQVCGTRYQVRRALINTYWCSATNITQYSGYLFGGLFGPDMPNPLTKSKACPPGFFPQMFLSNGLMVCLSNEYETATMFSVPFAGFFSCKAGNPLANNQYRCPPTFSQHLATISDGCQILFCVQSKNLTEGQLKPVRLPPFTRPALIQSLNKTVVIVAEGGRVWVRSEDSDSWRSASPEDVKRFYNNLDGSGLSNGGKVGVWLSVVVALALVIAGTVFFIKKSRSRSSHISSGYEQINGDEQEQVKEIPNSKLVCILKH